ncbi:nucleotidyltransferase family protein [Candidatus Viridilinea mediisalina]|uniref:Polymerase beta nucleotidyltransferase domain-containing protein n=1 Tax=Candidatus Viridilinea mediisalina TaxID=2024553 RepID=A0A2A6RH53_9CHLR|nr:hypothetical protein [Candidatus Viridilinea mediisalina]PDW02454.1 hypothetical protein CJ255_13890 [Candidatus Viridilinea mediisalina]
MPTIAPEALAHYRATARRHAKEREQALVAYRERAWAVAKAATTLLKATYGVERVVLFGSLARNESCFPHSDVDLVAWGLPEHLHYRVVAQLLDLDTSIAIDLLRGEELSERLQRRIAAEGVEL